MPADPASEVALETSPTGREDLHLSLPPTAEAVRDAHLRISSWMEGIRLDAELRGNAEIVLGEALNNVVEHAFAAWTDSQAQPDAIRLQLRQDRGDLRISIRDRGKEMPGLSLPEGHLPEIADQTELLPEGGFGWFLIRELSSYLDYGRQNGWNRLDLVLAPTPAAHDQAQESVAIP